MDRVFMNLKKKLTPGVILNYNCAVFYICTLQHTFDVSKCTNKFTFEPLHEKKQQCDFRTGSTQIELYKHRRWIEAGNFGLRK